MQETSSSPFFVQDQNKYLMDQPDNAMMKEENDDRFTHLEKNNDAVSEGSASPIRIAGIGIEIDPLRDPANASSVLDSLNDMTDLPFSDSPKMRKNPSTFYVNTRESDRSQKTTKFQETESDDSNESNTSLKSKHTYYLQKKTHQVVEDVD